MGQLHHSDMGLKRLHNPYFVFRGHAREHRVVVNVFFQLLLADSVQLRAGNHAAFSVHNAELLRNRRRGGGVVPRNHYGPDAGLSAQIHCGFHLRTGRVDHEKKIVGILYASAYGCTAKLAEAAFDELRKDEKLDVRLVNAVFTPFNELVKLVNEADALLIGSCTINRDAPKIIWDVLASVDAINTKQKPVGAFGAYGWSGEAVPMMKSRMLIKPLIGVVRVPTSVVILFSRLLIS